MAITTYCSLRRHIRPRPGEGEQQHDGHHRHRLRRQPVGHVSQIDHHLAETDGVERDPDGDGEEQHDAERAAEFEPDGPRDDVIESAALDRHAGGDRRQRQRRDKRDRIAERDDDQRVDQPHLAHHVAGAQIEDDPEDRQDRRREDAAECPKRSARRAFPGGPIRSTGHGQASPRDNPAIVPHGAPESQQISAALVANGRPQG